MTPMRELASPLTPTEPFEDMVSSKQCAQQWLALANRETTTTNLMVVEEEVAPPDTSFVFFFTFPEVDTFVGLVVPPGLVLGVYPA